MIMSGFGLISICVGLMVVQAIRKQWGNAGIWFLFAVICFLVMALLVQTHSLDIFKANEVGLRAKIRNLEKELEHQKAKSDLPKELSE